MGLILAIAVAVAGLFVIAWLTVDRLSMWPILGRLAIGLSLLMGWIWSVAALFILAFLTECA